MTELVLGESLETLIDHRGKTPKKLGGDFTTFGVRVISALHVRDGALKLENSKRVSEEMWRKWMPVTTKAKDVILTSEAPMGRTALIPDDAPYVLGQRVFGLRGKPGVLDSRFLFYALRSDYVQAQLAGRASGTTVLGIRQSELMKIKVPDPGYVQQQAIADVLGSLDDKIAVNERIAATSRQLALAAYAQETSTRPTRRAKLGSLVAVLSRGVAPKYSQNPDELLVLNQKCVRNGRVSLAPARRTLGSKVKTPKRLNRHDVLVNSTGVGTLGRVARWVSTEEATADSHITIVRFNPEMVDPVCGGFSLLAAQRRIEALGEGSTGQTELRRAQLEELEITVPEVQNQATVRAKLDILEEHGEAALSEITALAALRDTLLPQLMSGKLRVRDAERIVEKAV